jgi:hypothetical protein
MPSLRSKLRSLPLILSLVALFVALGGPSYAADVLNGKRIKNRSIAGKKLKSNSVGGRVVKESSLGKVPLAARANDATSADTATSAASATAASRAVTADSATNASQLGGVGAGGYTRRLWAVYDSTTDSIVRGSGALSVEPGGGPGVRAIRFNRNVSQCAWIATRGDQAAGGASTGFITTELASSVNTDQVIVRTRDATNSFFDAVDFHLVVVC